MLAAFEWSEPKNLELVFQGQVDALVVGSIQRFI
jgi:hypothetical protein